MIETDFILRALNNFAAMWSNTHINHLATFDVPHNLLGRRLSLLKGDINAQWARWFAESMADPRRIAMKNITYPFLYEDVLGAVEHRFHNNKTRTEKQQIASVVSRIIQKLSTSIKETRRRSAISFDERRILLDTSGAPPRCWICGAIFREQAIENFLFRKKYKIDLPPFVDFLKPRGLIERDLSIEVDHIFPFSKGGEDKDNVSLACGWCNRNKSASISIYEVEGQPRSAEPNELGISSLPQPFWIVRLLALVGLCENPNGCSMSAKNSEMTVAPIKESGALNPTNLRVTCYDHDPIRKNRLQSPSVVKRIWGR